MFGLRKKGKEGVKKFDRMITGIVLGGVVAGVFGYRKHKKKRGLRNRDK